MAHILIIDDSPTEQAGMSQMLHKHGHICSFANTGEIGVAASKKVKPDLILMDVVMPETNYYGQHQKPSDRPYVGYASRRK